MVTDLDAHLIERALASLSAELTRREHILAAAGAKDIEDYTASCWPAGRQRRRRRRITGRAPLEPLPRLVIVIDEFASLVRDLPDFVTGLVNIAQRGRSLGIHLILATQRPSGVVSADIRANTNLRIALRVTDAGRERRRDRRRRTPRTSPESTPGRGVRAARPRLARPVPGRADRRPPARRRPGDRPPGRGWRRWTGPAWAARNRPGRPRVHAGRRGDHRPEGPGRADPAGRRRAAHPRPAQSVAARRCPRTLLLRDLPRARRQASRPGAGTACPFGLDDLPAAAAAAAGGARPGHLRAPDGGRRAAVRAVTAAAHDRRGARG